MTGDERCRYGGPTKDNGNCTEPDDEGVPVQCVGAWASEKHYYLGCYVEATWGPRQQYIPPRGHGGAAYVDLFAGPGRGRVRTTGELVAGSPLIAVGHEKAPFTKVVLCDLSEENISALRHRTSGDRRVELIEGDCNAEIDRVESHIPEYGLNVALLDPYAPKQLKWTTIAKLGRLRRMDLLIHFPTGPIKRNFHHQGFHDVIDQMIGTTSWRKDVKQAQGVARLIEHFRAQLVNLGYEGERVRSLPITNENEVILYHLMFASKSRRGNEIWKSITNIDAKGQRGWPL